MAENKAAKVISRGTFLYKNSMLDALPDDSEYGQDVENYIHIPNIENLTTLLSTMTPTYDSNNELLYYASSTYKDSDNIKIDFGGNLITLFYCDSIIGDKKIGAKEVPSDHIIGADRAYYKEPINTEMYGLCAPGKTEEYSYYKSHYNYFSNVNNIYDSYRNDLYSHSAYEMSDLVSMHFEMNSIRNLPIKYDVKKDRILIPHDVPQFNGTFSTNVVPCQYFPKTNGNNVYRDGFGAIGSNTRQGPIAISTQFNAYYPVYYGYISQMSIDDTSTSALQRSRRTCLFITDNNDNVYAIAVEGTVGVKYKSVVYGFITDSNSNIYLYIYVNYWWDEGSRPDNKNQYFIYPVDKLKGYSANYNTTSGTWDTYDYTRYYLNVTNTLVNLKDKFDVVGVIKGILGGLIDSDKVPKPDDELFNDGGPDIDGAGDPYNTDEFNNVGSSVGGDADPGKDLNSVDATPNTSFDSFMQDTGFFGSYVLSNSDLVKYTKTLRMLYSNASNPVWGEAAGLQADHIVKNTIGLHMLPITIPSTDYASTTFSMGTVGISESGKFLSYSTGNDYANANYLKKLTKTFSVPLGKIKHNYDNFLDFAPYSSASLYIPYIGKVELPINLIQSTSEEERILRLEFRVNYSSGDFVAILFCNIKGVEVAVSHWNGNCARNVKVSVDDDSSAIIAGANRIASMFSASMSLTSGSNNFGGTLTGNNNNVRNNYYENKQMNSNMNLDQTTSGKTGGITFSTPSAPSTVTTNQHMIGNGSVNGELGYLGIQDIVLTVERPVWWKPYDYGNLVGYPTKKVAKLSSVKGFAKISDAHIRCYATASEKEEIASLLAEGVIF